MVSAPTNVLRLLVQCPDRPGIVAAVSQFLFVHGANIMQADQFSTADGAGRFFLRVEFQTDALDCSQAELEAQFAAEIAERFEMDWRLSGDRRKRAALLASRFDHCLLDLLWRWRRGELDVDIPLVISNHDALRDDVATFGIPYHYLPVEKGKRAEQEAQIRELLREHDVDLVVLARYMQILSGDFIREYPNRIINIHHSFLPAFAGADPYGRAFDRGVKIIGATAHYATEDLDEGPIIEQDVERVTHRDSRDDLVRVGREVERSVLARAVQWHLEDRVFVHENRTVVFR
ncbi:MAG: formyltetrahydrofolate deformylase [Dehalococcoidia bacterium]|nr:formyltetrahydrofolate deformylase [Dehalococcoidia bacterium]MCB9483676.1 formyltetrahydrofolate deformylase [Dehalococcoidia bacterium]MCB9491122.1 formyltetrahydrofolate deformylase [Dehalococcoidia bacterium]